jgi:NADPH-dependent glutamate synthase beta subunit-like oxidoreductase
MPAAEEEVIAAEEEGVKFKFLIAPFKILGKDSKVQAIECYDMDLKEFDSSGRRTPEPIPGSQHIINVDMVLEAVGQQPDSRDMELGGVKLDKAGRIIANKRTLATNVKGVFAGGDAFTGPATVIEAVAAGQRAASSIRDYLHGKELSNIVHRNGYTPIPISSIAPTEEETKSQPRVHIPEIPISVRKTSFEEVVIGYNPRDARNEAARCLRCDLEINEEE